MSLKGFKKAVRSAQTRNASTFEADVKELLDTENAQHDSLDHPLSVEIVTGVSKARIKAVKTKYEAKGWKVEVDPEGTSPRRYISFTDPKKSDKGKRKSGRK